MKKIIIGMIALLLLSNCASQREWAGENKGKILLGAIIVGAAIACESQDCLDNLGDITDDLANEYDNNKVIYRGTSSDNDDWDYLPGSNQYRCRAISSNGYDIGGRFLVNTRCADDIKEDSWY